MTLFFKEFFYGTVLKITNCYKNSFLIWALSMYRQFCYLIQRFFRSQVPYTSQNTNKFNLEYEALASRCPLSSPYSNYILPETDFIAIRQRVGELPEDHVVHIVQNEQHKSTKLWHPNVKRSSSDRWQ